MSITKLPIYPGARAREALSASQVASLNANIASALAQVLSLPQDKRDKSTSTAFISSYARNHAQRILHSLIWEASGPRSSHLMKLSTAERTIHERTLRLSEKFANELDLQTLIDLAVVYGPRNPKRFRALLLSVSKNIQIVTALESEAVPAFTALLSSNSQGLYGVRKIAYILRAFLHSAPSEFVRPFARNKDFVLALAKAYDDGLASCARSYGGMRPERISQSTPLDDWERIFLDTKVALIDSVHIVLRTLLTDVEEVEIAGSALAARCDIAFEIVFALLDLPSTQLNETNSIPFLNQSLLGDYQHTYDLSRLLADATRRADDPRTELLESTLRALNTSAQDPQARPGALKLLIRSSGVQPGIDNLGKGPSRVDAKGKGRAAAPASAPAARDDPALDAAVSQVLDILPEQPPQYVRFVLSHPDYPYKGEAGRLVEALLEGTAPSLEEYEATLVRVEDINAGLSTAVEHIRTDEGFVYTKERRNVFDEQAMTLSQVRVGKKRDDGVLQDKTFLDQMKADILRRAEEMSESEEEAPVGRKAGGIDVAFEDELEEGRFKVRDGEETEDIESGVESEDRDGEDNTPKSPETILELAYIADPKVFDRDAATRRSKARNDLRAQTGWADEQIEGWRVMLERNPNKDRILQKHEFAGNKRGLVAVESRPASQQSQGRGRGQGQGRGRGGGGRGRGRGGPSHGREGGNSSGGGGQPTGGSSARERAWKDKNKASRGNHNRKSGHDKKMARAGGPS